MWPILLVGIVALTVYYATLAPSLTWEHWGTDGGDFITAASTGRVPHPPGFPVYYIISRTVVTVVPGDPARLLNGLSALMGAGAACFTTAALQRWGISPWASAAAGTSLAFAPWLWSQAVITEVYTTAALFASAATYLISLGGISMPARAWAIGLAIGLAASVHPTTFGILLVLVPLPGVAWPWLSLGLGLGLLPYALLPLAGPWPQPWGDLRSFEGWWHFVSARIYWGNAFGLALVGWPRRLLAWTSHLVRQFTPLGAFAVLVGGQRLWSRDRALAIGVLLALGVVSLHAMAYDTADSWVYLVAYLPVVAILLGIGLQQLTALRVPAPAALAVPFLSLLINWSPMNLDADTAAVDWLAQALAKAPPRAAILTQEDAHTFALWYGVDALRERDDITVVDRRLWGFEPYVVFIEDRVGRPIVSLDALADGGPLCQVASSGRMTCR